MSFKKDITELLYFILHQMATDQLAYIRGIHGVTVNTIEIHEKDFKDKVSNYCFLTVVSMMYELYLNVLIYFLQVKQIDVHDFRPFFDSKLFKNNNFVYDEKRHLIVQTLLINE